MTTIPTESADQQSLVEWFDIAFPSLRGRLAAVPNGGVRPKATAGRMKAEGVRAGYPDLQLLTPRCGFAGLIIEMKRRKGGTLTPEQKDWLAWLGEQGFQAVVCRGFDEAKVAIEHYLR